MERHERIADVEFADHDMDVIKSFFSSAFGWRFTYQDLQTHEQSRRRKHDLSYSRCLQILLGRWRGPDSFYSEHLKGTVDKVKTAGGTSDKPVFSLPGERRIPLTEPGGNEFVVWPDKGLDKGSLTRRES